MSTARVSLWPELQRATISPMIYGHFAEHLGRCIYEGIWVGPKSRIPNDGGLRLDVLAALRQLRAPVLRWPGGCFADAYHWRDGVGPAKQRPETVNLWWHQAEPNDFGTDEFMRLCKAVECAPYICVNVGSGTPQEALEWLEYCNYAGESTLSRQRGKNGSAEPYGVKYWGIGNENWGCGGRFRAEDYAKKYVRYASYMRGFDPAIEMVACGFGPGETGSEWAGWNQAFCANMPHADLIDHLSIHRYFKRGAGAAFSDSEYHSLFGDLHALERDLQLTDALLSYFYPDKPVGIAVDEWGVWHPSAVVDNGLEQEATLRDAVFAGACLNLFNRYAHRVTMANLAQTINVLQCVALTQGGKMILTPTYHVFDMMRPHMGARLVTHALECDTYETHPVSLRGKRPVDELSVSASLAENKLFLTLANQTVDKDIETKIVLKGVKAQGISAKVLNSADARDQNTFANPKSIAPARQKSEGAKDEWVHVVPAHSFAAVTLTLD